MITITLFFLILAITIFTLAEIGAIDISFEISQTMLVIFLSIAVLTFIISLISKNKTKPFS